jgi:hypothetical protein
MPSRSRRSPAQARRSRAELRLLEKLVHSVALFLIHSGTDATKVTESLRNAIAEAEKASAQAAVLRDLYVAISKLLHTWHQDPDFLDDQARPLPLSVRGKSRSVEALARRAGVRMPIATLVGSLKSQRLLRVSPRNRVLPTRSVARIRTNGPELTGYVGQSVLQLLSTLHFNRNGGRRGPLLERTAIVQDLPQRQVEKFRQYSSDQGAAFVSGANRWLESRRSKSSGKAEQVVTAGVHVFAFVTPAPEKPTP